MDRKMMNAWLQGQVQKQELTTTKMQQKRLGVLNEYDSKHGGANLHPYQDERRKTSKDVQLPPMPESIRKLRAGESEEMSGRPNTPEEDAYINAEREIERQQHKDVIFPSGFRPYGPNADKDIFDAPGSPAPDEDRTKSPKYRPPAKNPVQAVKESYLHMLRMAESFENMDPETRAIVTKRMKQREAESQQDPSTLPPGEAAARALVQDRSYWYAARDGGNISHTEPRLYGEMQLTTTNIPRTREDLLTPPGGGRTSMGRGRTTIDIPLMSRGKARSHDSSMSRLDSLKRYED